MRLFNSPDGVVLELAALRLVLGRFESSLLDGLSGVGGGAAERKDLLNARAME